MKSTFTQFDERWFIATVMENARHRCQGYLGDFKLQINRSLIDFGYNVLITGIDDCGLLYNAAWHVDDVDELKRLTDPQSKEWDNLAEQLISKKRTFDEDRSVNLTP